jgi:DNA primase
MRDGRLFFLCPHCHEMQATVNPRNNLAHCFHCHKNLNNIDLLMMLGYDFVAAVAVLEGLLERHESRLPTRPATPAAK